MTPIRSIDRSATIGACHTIDGLERDEQLARVVGFVLDVRPTQYCALLYEHEGNAALRRDLLERMEARRLGRAWLATLPLGIRRAVEAERQA